VAVENGAPGGGGLGPPQPIAGGLGNPSRVPETIVIKLGGDVLEGAALGAVADSLQAIVTETAHALAIVHGGGTQVTALSERLGLPTRMVGGRRITDAAALEVLQMVVAGKLNVELCAALQARGVRAVGLHAGSGVLRARKRPPRVMSGAGPDPIDMGLVGDVVGFDLPLLEALWAASRLPVLSSLGLEGGAVLNLNADLVASQLAATLEASSLIAVTAVGGVRRDKDDPATRIGRLTVSEARAAIASGVVHGGMIPKLEEAFVPLEAGVERVQIVAPQELASAVRDPGSAGTMLVADARA
jgi:acetylglutamate kinase